VQKQRFLSDGVRQVDYVLAYDLDVHENELKVDSPETTGDVSPRKHSNHQRKKNTQREYFQTQLELQGLQLELVNARVN
jgi:hypothetical protein